MHNHDYRIVMSKAEVELRPIDHLSAQDGYDRWAAVYDDEENPLIALEEPQVRELLGDVRGLTILDLGCGTGRHTSWLAAAGADVTAVDFSNGMLARARAKPGASFVHFVVHDLHQPLPFPAESFDRIVCGLVLDHVIDLPGLLSEARRVLRPAGSAVFSVMHPAMMLKGVQARFVDPNTGLETRPASAPNQVSDYVMAATRAGFRFRHMSDHAADESLAQKCPRAEKYIGWPMLLVMRLVDANDSSREPLHVDNRL